MLLAFKNHVTVPGSGVTGPTMQPGRPWVVRSWLGGCLIFSGSLPVSHNEHILLVTGGGQSAH